jgi:prevent-host-death family protein
MKYPTITRPQRHGAAVGFLCSFVEPLVPLAWLLDTRTQKRTIKASLKEREMNTLTASEARANLYRLIDQTVESHEPIIITGKRSSAVLLSAEDWRAIQETLYLLAVPGMRESIKAGMAEPLAKSSKELKW